MASAGRPRFPFGSTNRSGQTRGATNSLMSNEERAHFQLAVLHKIDVFAWRHSDMVGISSMVASHELNVLPTAKPVRQRVRRFHRTYVRSFKQK